MKFSICIPNYNYERYLGSTIRSVLEQADVDLEILLSDNASTDGSVALAQSFGDPRIQVRVNAVNVGFAGNLDRAARLATGDWLIMLSSDDLALPGALASYRRLIEALGSGSRRGCADRDDADDFQRRPAVGADGKRRIAVVRRGAIGRLAARRRGSGLQSPRPTNCYAAVWCR